MKKTNHFYRFCALALSCLLLISLLPVTQVLADGDGAIHIKSAEDLRSLAHSCTLDSWSRGKTVVLDNDIELTDDDELPIPTFGGTFSGLPSRRASPPPVFSACCKRTPSSKT